MVCGRSGVNLVLAVRCLSQPALDSFRLLLNLHADLPLSWWIVSVRQKVSNAGRIGLVFSAASCLGLFAGKGEPELPGPGISQRRASLNQAIHTSLWKPVTSSPRREDVDVQYTARSGPWKTWVRGHDELAETSRGRPLTAGDAGPDRQDCRPA
ncbi:hypothetical protein BaRGS_00007843 [Batillaria attramentaria]|uniref:Uncharacterized protein n=1 Tax=Batillaria attramentaria TaxID=370345 RepID=A0ABD0LNB0_9CAEN